MIPFKPLNCMKYAGECHCIKLIYMCCSVFCSQGYRHLITNGKNKKMLIVLGSLSKAALQS